MGSRLKTSAAVCAETESPRTKDKTANMSWTAVCAVSQTAAALLLGGKVPLGFVQNTCKRHRLGIFCAPLTGHGKVKKWAGLPRSKSAHV